MLGSYFNFPAFFIVYIYFMKKFLSVIFYLSCCLLAFADNQTVQFSITPFFEFEAGKYGEYIYDNNKNPISGLEWDLFPVIKNGFQLNFGYRPLSFVLDISAGYPLKSGKMKDSDWIEKAKCIYSENQVYSQTNINLGVSTFYDFYFNDFILSPALQIEYQYNSFMAKEGYGWYGIAKYSKNGETVSWDDSNAKYFDKISGYSTYAMTNFYSFTGIKVSTNLSDKISLSLLSLISPYSYMKAHDNHYRKDGKKTKYIIARQNNFFVRFKEVFTTELKLSNSFSLESTLSAFLGVKEFGEYSFYSLSPLDEDSFYLSQKGLFASDIYLINVKLGGKISLQ